MIKLVAVDMDGTFLDSNKQYNVERFMTLYERMKGNDVRFVVASGNQFYQLISFFPEINRDISFVAENGAYVVHQNEEVFCAKLSDEQVWEVINYLTADHPDVRFIVCGKKSAYLLEKDKAIYNTYVQYYHRLKIVDSFEDIPDDETIFKFALTTTEEHVRQVQQDILPNISHFMDVQLCGHGDIDLNVKGINKAHGLKHIQEIYGIKADECVAFGDNQNDLAMLEHVGLGFAMANAIPEVKDAIIHHAPSNDEAGVLVTLEDILY